MNDTSNELALLRAATYHRAISEARAQRDQAILDAYASGASYRDIAEAIGTGHTTIADLIRERGKPRPVGGPAR